MSYISKQNCSFEYEIKKSKFLAFLFYVNNVNETKNILLDLQNKYGDATHICYAYVILDNGVKEKSVDDSEPSNTAGKPILDCIKKNNLVNTMIVVVRYFGGIKLGAGGLTRAYNHSAKSVVDACKESFVPYIEYEQENLEVSYNKFEDFKNFCAKNKIDIVSSKFDEKVIVEIKYEKGSEFYFESYKN